ncbi:MAG: TolC family protein [Longimicrobiales bacterium]
MEYTLPSRRACGVLMAVLGLAFAGDAAAQEPQSRDADPAAQAAQEPVMRLTLEQAIEIARGSNPTYLITANDEGDAVWQQREAYAAFLPSVSVNGAGQYVAEGTPNLGFLTGADLGVGKVPSSYYSSYGIEGAIELSGATLFEASRASANRKATSARVDAAGFTLATEVTQQYLAALRAQDEVRLAQESLESAQQSYELAVGQFEAGAAPRLDVTNAEVTRGRAEVALLQAEQSAQTEKLRLVQTLGFSPDAPLELVSTFEIFEPTWTMDELTERALASHPQLVAARASESAGVASARATKMQYLPSLRLAARLSGYSRQTGDDQALLADARSTFDRARANCIYGNRVGALLGDAPEDCSGLVLTPEAERQLLAANDVFPFDFTSNPATVTLSVNFPIFNGFTRERQVQEARSAADDARHRRRAEELARRTEVSEAYVALVTAYRTVAIEERNVAAAAEQLELARERYRLGAGDIVELAQAQATKAEADNAHLSAIYTFHENYAALEAAVGEPLR